MKYRPIMMSAPMVRALLDGTKTQTRRVVKPKEGRIVGPAGPGIAFDQCGTHLTTVICPYGQPGDRLLCYHCSHEHQSRAETDSSITERRLHGGVGRTDLQSHEVQGIRSQGTGGLVPAAGPHDSKRLPNDLNVAREREGHKVGASAGVHGVSRDAECRDDGGAAPEWRPDRQQAGELVLGNCRGELAGQAVARPGDSRREASISEVHGYGARAHQMGGGARSLQPAAGGPCSRCGAVVDSRHRVGGSRLWVRETFFAWGRWERRFSAKKGCDEWHFIDLTQESGQSYLYAADGVSDTKAFIKRRGGVEPMYWKRPAIFMPRAACRITLEITSVRVERLQDINEADALAEGVDEWACGAMSRDGQRDYPPVEKYRLLWEQINGPGSWDANPFIWVIDFKTARSG